MGTIYRNGVPFVGSGGAGGVEMTEAEYELLPESEKMNGAIYFITDGDVSYPSASQMRYDNTESQIPATSVQGAIDENRIEINDLKAGLTLTTKDALVEASIAQGSTNWASASGTVSGGYKKYIITCGSRGALYNTLVVDIDELNLQGVRVSAYWDTTNLGQVTLNKNGNTYSYETIAKTASLAFHYSIFGLK